MEDKDIVALYEARSERAIVESASKYGRYCRAIADRVLASPEDTEECLNDTWLSAWNSIPPHKPQNLKTFLGKLTRNHAIGRFRAKSAEKRAESRYTLALDELAEVLPDPDENGAPVDRIALRDALDRFLGALPKRTRTVFVKRYWYFTPICTIADELGMSDGAVRILLHRTRESLRKSLQKEGLL